MLRSNASWSAGSRYAEETYRQIMVLQAQLLGPDATRRTYQHLETRLDDLDHDPEEATIRISKQPLSQSDHRTPPNAESSSPSNVREIRTE